ESSLTFDPELAIEGDLFLDYWILSQTGRVDAAHLVQCLFTSLLCCGVLGAMAAEVHEQEEPLLRMLDSEGAATDVAGSLCSILCPTDLKEGMSPSQFTAWSNKNSLSLWKEVKVVLKTLDERAMEFGLVLDTRSRMTLPWQKEKFFSDKGKGRLEQLLRFTRYTEQYLDRNTAVTMVSTIDSLLQYTALTRTGYPALLLASSVYCASLEAGYQHSPAALETLHEFAKILGRFMVIESRADSASAVMG
ncbi:MAG: hypothetical protein FWG11_04565, partial [Promicromonosporaceae bacterium]|nr:hypothetical protein [Promicromonosporaceae bacterium]